MNSIVTSLNHNSVRFNTMKSILTQTQNNLRQDPHNLSLHFKELIIYQGLADWKKVIAKANEIARLYPSQNNFALSRKANAYLKLGDMRSAFEIVALALAQHADNAIAYEVRGDIHSFSADWESAIADYSIALAWDPSLQNARIERARAYFKIGKITEANADFDVLQSTFQTLGDELEIEEHIFGPRTDW